MAFTLQPATKDDFVNREKILDEMFSTLADERTRMGFGLVSPRKVGKAWLISKYMPTNL